MQKPKTLYNETAIDYLINPLFQVQDVDENLKKLGIHRKELRALEGDDEITAAIETRRESLIATSWRLEAGKSRQNNFLLSELDKVIVSVLRGAFDAVLYGYSVQEVIYQQLSTGGIGIKEVSAKPFEWFEPKSNGDLVYRSQLDPLGTVVDTEFKFLKTVRNEIYRQPYGEALLSRLYFPWFFRTNGWRFWAKNLERAGTPFLSGTAPDSILPDGTPAIDYLSTVLNNAVSNATLALPEGWTAQFLSAPQTGTTFEQFENALLKRIQRVILGQTLTSDVGSSGSYAAAKVHQSVLDDRRIADIRLVTKTVQTLVNALHTLNGFSGEPPLFVMEDETGLELERADRDSKLVQAGVLKLTPEYLTRVYDYEEGDFEIPQAVDTNVKQVNDRSQNLQANFSASNEPVRFTKDQQLIEDLADKALENIKSPISEKSIFNAIKAAKDYDDLVDRLAVLYRDTDTVEFRTMLERCTFAADLMGYVNVTA